MLNKEDTFAVWGINTLTLADSDRVSIRPHVESIIDFWCESPDATLKQLQSDSAFCLLYVQGMCETALKRVSSLGDGAQQPMDLHTLDGFFAFYKYKLAKDVDGDAFGEYMDVLRSNAMVRATGGGPSARDLSRLQHDAIGYTCNVATMYLLARVVGSKVADRMALEFGRVWPQVQSVLTYNMDEPRSRL